MSERERENMRHSMRESVFVRARVRVRERISLVSKKQLALLQLLYTWVGGKGKEETGRVPSLRSSRGTSGLPLLPPRGKGGGGGGEEAGESVSQSVRERGTAKAGEGSGEGERERAPRRDVSAPPRWHLN